MNYTRSWLQAQIDAGQHFKYILFWGHKNTGTVTKTCFSQWYESPFVHAGDDYRTAEHWMMAGKARTFGDEEMLQKILAAGTPGEAKKLGRQVRGFTKEGWDAVKRGLVAAGNLLKFGQNEAMGEFLLQTGQRIIVEASPRDRIWGIGLGPNNPAAENPYNWRGQNLLGFALMEVRDWMAEHGPYVPEKRELLPEAMKAHL